MGGAKGITSLMADSLKLISKFCLPICVGGIVSSTDTLIRERGLDYHGVHIAHLALPTITKDNNGHRLGPFLEVANFPISLSLRTMQDLGSI